MYFFKVKCNITIEYKCILQYCEFTKVACGRSNVDRFHTFSQLLNNDIASLQKLPECSIVHID